MPRPAAIVPLADDNHFINMIVYGEPGVGKSALAGTSSNSLILANDKDETTSAAIRGSKAHKWVISDYDDLTKAVEYLQHEGYRDYDWVWIDNATLFQEQGMSDIMADVVAAKPHRNQWVPDKAEYQINQNHLSDLIRRIKNTPMHFGMTAHSMRMEDEDGKVVYKPRFQGGQGALSDKFCGWMNVVAYMTSVKVEGGTRRTLLFEKSGKFYAKDRFGVLGERMHDPSIPRITAVIKKHMPTLGQPVKATGTAKKAAATKKAVGVVKKTTKAAKVTKAATKKTTRS